MKRKKKRRHTREVSIRKSWPKLQTVLGRQPGGINRKSVFKSWGALLQKLL